MSHARLIGALLLVLGVAAGGLYVSRTLQKARAHDGLAERVRSLEEAHERLSAEVVRRSEFDRAVREARASISKNLDEVTHEDPDARDYLGESIPDGVRDAFRR